MKAMVAEVAMEVGQGAVCGRRELGFWRGHSGFRELGPGSRAQLRGIFPGRAQAAGSHPSGAAERIRGPAKAFLWERELGRGAESCRSARKDETLLPGQLLWGMPKPQPAWPLGSPGAVTALGSTGANIALEAGRQAWDLPTPCPGASGIDLRWLGAGGHGPEGLRSLLGSRDATA